MQHVKYSVIIPVFNRPQEITELLESLTQQTYKHFEVILVEDGSSNTSEEVYRKYKDRLYIRYFFKPNTGPGPSRNFGFEQASGDYFVMFDSDCILPPIYFKNVDDYLGKDLLDAWGGPDRGRKDFTLLQQAMGYTMASVLTTGGIRGGKKNGFQPRSFNMGISRQVFEKTKGFKFDRFAEDIELSIRIRNLGFRIGLIPEAYVFHKRRTTFSQFFQQVYHFGKGRALVGRVHPGTIKIAHWFPTFFLIGMVLIPILFPFYPLLSALVLTIYFTYFALIAFSCYLATGTLVVAFLSVPASFIQLVGYGLGFLKEFFRQKNIDLIVPNINKTKA